MNTEQYFRRAMLARQLAERILDATQSNSASSGVFLSAPRRTGKSTFLREDLRPALEASGAHVLYVDLWSDKKSDPGELIVSAVRSALAGFDGVLKRLAKKSGLQSVAAGPVSFSLEQIGLGTSVTMTAALVELSDELRKPIVLIIDEAQHAIVSESGYDALFALKAARDELNSSAHFGLRIVATGSNRDKLAMLRESKDQAFFGAPLVEFPSLGRDYVDWFCARASLGSAVTSDLVWELFEKAAFRPEMLGAAADDVRFVFGLSEVETAQRFQAAVEAQIENADSQLLRVINSLTPLQSSVLRVMATRKEAFAPFAADTMRAYEIVLRQLAPDEAITADTSNVQQALSALQDKMLIWKERRGVYSLEESAIADLLVRHNLLDVVSAPGA